MEALNLLELGTLAAYIATILPEQGTDPENAGAVADAILEHLSAVNVRSCAEEKGQEARSDDYLGSDLIRWARRKCRSEVSAAQALAVFRQLNANVRSDVCEPWETQVLYEVYDLVVKRLDGPGGDRLRRLGGRRFLLGSRALHGPTRALLHRRMQSLSDPVSQESKV